MGKNARENRAIQKKENMDLKKAEWDKIIANNPHYTRDTFIKIAICLIAFIIITVFLINSTTPSYLWGGIAYACLVAIWKGWEIK